MSVRGDMDVKAGTADIKGSYGGDMKVDAETVKIAGSYGGDVRINAERIYIEPGTKIGGDLIAPNLAELRDGIIVGGDVKIGKGTGKSKDRKVSIIIDTDKEAARDAEASRADRREAKLDEAQAKIDEAKAKVDAALREVDINQSTKDAIKDAISRKVAEHEERGDFDHNDRDDVGLISPEPMGMKAWLTVLVTLAACGALALGFAPQFLVQATERLAKEPLPSLVLEPPA